MENFCDFLPLSPGYETTKPKRTGQR